MRTAADVLSVELDFIFDEAEINGIFNLIAKLSGFTFVNMLQHA
jgi:hypothetical protein